MTDKERIKQLEKQVEWLLQALRVNDSANTPLNIFFEQDIKTKWTILFNNVN